ncbi:hypothetical protein I7I52_06187 [Histoplasma capsulatum]|uniref:Uncharacterized protein n=1 Tax=Ajellomyces capsulatus TaxID=5037 RepID=A0A8H7YT62_AJECA|nr:hypothetical protein I7I52_06187 [Histoplasma capsulatum]
MTSQALLVRRVGMLASRTNLTTKATPKRTKRTKKPVCSPTFPISNLLK